MSRSRRHAAWLALTLGMIGLFVLSACAGSTTAPTATSAPSTGGTSATPSTGGTAAATQPSKPAVDRIVIGMSQEPPELAPGLGTAYVSAVVKNAVGTETTNSGTAQLLWRNDKNEIIPGIAESVPLLNDSNLTDCAKGACFKGAEGSPDRYLEVTYKLRKNVKWHDGSPVTANDAKFAIEYVLQDDFQAADKSQEYKIESVKVVDDSTVVYSYRSEKQALDAYNKEKAAGKSDDDNKYVAFKDQKGPVTDPLYNRIGYVIPQKTYKDIPPGQLKDSEYNRSKENGLGAYKLKAREAGQSITLEANPDFFLGAPKIKEIQFRIITDTEAMKQAVRNKEVDIVTEDALSEFDAPDLDAIANEGRIKAFYTPSSTWEHININLDKPGLNDIKIRQAIIQGINRQAVIDKVLNGKTKVIHSWIDEGNPFYNKDVPKWAYDKAKAEDAIKSAGYTKGADGIYAKGSDRLSFKLSTTGGNKRRQLVVERVTADLKEIGIEIQSDYIPGRGLFANDGPLTRRTFDLALYAFVTGDDPAGQDIWKISNIPSAQNSYTGQNYPGWKNPQQDQLITVATTEISTAKRAEAYKQHQVLYAQDIPDIPMYARANVTVAPKALENYKPTPSNTPPTWNAQDWYMPKS